MKIEFVEKARKDLQELTETQQRKIKDKIQELEKQPTGHEDSKIIQIKGQQLYRLKIKEERNGEIDHRAIYRIENGQITIYSIINRDTGYQKEKIQDRL